MTTTFGFQGVDFKGSKWHCFVETLKVVPNPIVISLQDLVVTWVTIETVAKKIDYQSMTLQIEFERKMLHVGIHHLPVCRSGSDCTSTGSRSVHECQSPEKYGINIDSVPLAIPTQSQCRVQSCPGSNSPTA